ncbi:MAG: DEAD/DEAH box helicase family protein [Verrucomicrobiales bacterium]|nr:DEAD/DEAH box helicase family protein [Verrucomicrobiales bacterium]
MHEAEWQTRKQRIDTRLRGLNPPWDIIPYHAGLDVARLTRHAVTEFPTANGPADYALFVHGRFLGILEAKKLAVNPQNVLEQAKRYARGAFHGPGDWRGYRVPFLYACNGPMIWFLDVRAEKPVSRQLSAFHTAPALEALFAFDLKPAHDWLLDTPPDILPLLREYQRQCLLATEAAILAGRRELLVAMATGTGKTLLTVAQIYRLLESRLARRILFLVDRKALAAQAVREFHAFSTPQNRKFTQEYEVYSQRFQREDFGPDTPFDPQVLPNAYLTHPRPSQTFVYVSTIQRMARNLFGAEACLPQAADDAETDPDAERLDIPIHAFDLIVADECHRGYTAQELSVWRDTIQHFDAVRIGLTATPAAHTTALFGPPVFRYTVEQAILDGYLVDYEPVALKSHVRMNGVFLREGETVERVDTESGQRTLDQLEDEREFAAPDLERRITAPDSNRQIIQEVARYAYEHEAFTGRFPKILIFAVNDLPHTSHADQLVRICREVFAQGDEFVQKITGNPNVDRPLQRIREFRNRPHPKVVVTVDMLSTGVDIPALEFIVFLRPVKSRILWEQMLGRGTRRCPDIHKSKFVVFDCFDGTLIRYFQNVSSFAIEPPRATPLPIPRIIENIWQNVDRDYHVKVLTKRLLRVDKDMSPEARTAFARWVPDGDMGAFARDLAGRLKRDFTGTIQLLRDAQFQRLLLEYPRAKRPFLVGLEVQDQVTSRKLERYGAFDTAEGYLDAFAAFVKANASQVDALAVLLRRPRDWRPAVLDDLKRAMAKEGFDPAQLQRAHRARGFKSLADVISMVKHAAAHQAPLLTAEERVNRAMDRFLDGRTLTTEQRQWLSLVREHLVQNLSMDEEDFDLTPLLGRRGGKAKARKVFGELELLVTQLNEAMVV